MEATRILRPLVAGNWKMNGLRSQLAEALRVRDALSGRGPETAADVMICPPATLIPALAEAARGSKLLVGAQDCHPAAAGAHTGDIAAEMVADAGAVAVIVGHSERRVAHGELDRLVRLKAEAAHRAGLTAIVCIGETAGSGRRTSRSRLWGASFKACCQIALARRTRRSLMSRCGPSERGARRAPPT